jgi:hypothetical protein
MQLHFVLDHRCDLKTRGWEAFLADLTPLAIWRDLAEGVDAFADYPSEQGASSLSAAQSKRLLDRASDPAVSLESVRVALPKLARLENDPVSGQISGAQLLARAKTAAERGAICRGCPALAVNPSRFGCWVSLALPGGPALATWALARWAEGRRLSGGSGELPRLTRLRGGRGAASRILLPPDKRASLQGAARRRVWDIRRGVREELSLDALLAFLLNVGVLEARHQIALLRDFAALDLDALAYLEELRRESPRAAATKEAAPFLLQPRPDDAAEVIAFKAMLHLCYWALYWGRSVGAYPVFLDSDANSDGGAAA